jgi:thiol-disulfide isomerase/thioredoxin
MPTEEKAFRRALDTGLRGGLIVGLGALAGQLVTRHDFHESLFLSLIAAAVAAVVFFIGQAVAGGVIGALLGGLVFLLLGAFAGQQLGLSYTYFVPAEIQPPHPALSAAGGEGRARGGKELEITGPTLTGEAFSIRQWRGQIVFVDFWATWCVPCVAELPTVRRVYERHHKDGFQIVGVSLDSDRERLEQFIKQKEILWPQIFFDEPGKQGWQNPLARKYGIQAIPMSFLLDPEGRVFAADLRGPELETAVTKLLAKEPDEDTAVSEQGVRLRRVRVPLGLILGGVLGCFVGGLGGAWIERRIRK